MLSPVITFLHEKTYIIPIILEILGKIETIQSLKECSGHSFYYVENLLK